MDKKKLICLDEPFLNEYKKDIAASEKGTDTFFKLTQNCLEHYPREFTKWFLEAIVQNGDLSNNPFKSKFDKNFIDYHQEFFADLARIFLNKFSEYNEERKEYISLTQVIEDNVDFRFYLYRSRLKSPLAFTEFAFTELIKKLHDYLVFCFNISILSVCRYVYWGLPLYKRDSSDGFVKVSESDNHFIYIFMNGYYLELCPEPNYPEWVKEYFFRTEQLKAHEQFFGDYFSGDDKTTRVIRTAFRKSIGEEDVFYSTQNINNDSELDKTIVPGHHNTKLMRIQKKVIERFYGEQFDINDPETLTKQIIVVDWLKNEYGLSNREAQAIDMITRPESARGK